MRSRKWTIINKPRSSGVGAPKLETFVSSNLESIGKFIIALVVTLTASSSFARPWNEHTGKLTGLSRQLETGEKEIQDLIKHKRHAHDPKEVAHIMHEIETKHKALEKAAKEYEEERKHVRFEHPEKNDTLERKYVRHEFKSIETLEKELGIHGKLDHVKSRVLSMFPIPVDTKLEDAKARFRTPASVKPIDEDAPDQIHLVK